jgi:16S rRNA (guanine966-N2)-methyltransferase
MRVIAGQYRSRVLRSLPGLEVRPTADRLRESLFNVLCAGNPKALAGTVWVDLYAGTGAVGIEALSRWASMVYFVDSSKAAVDLIAANLKALGVEGGFRILNSEVARSLARLATSQIVADFVFVDPPYKMRDEYERTLGLLGESKLLRPSGLVIVEHEKKFDPGGVFGELRRYRTIVQGDASVSFYRADTEL